MVPSNNNYSIPVKFNEIMHDHMHSSGLITGVKLIL